MGDVIFGWPGSSHLLDFLEDFQFLSVTVSQVSVVGLVGQKLGHFLIGSSSIMIQIPIMGLNLSFIHG